ncbi:MAG: tRNA (adenosine(37)-N6)-threonylcarbamoyltransferase complex ATPase subunit type 1 TsaE [Luteolibacter sp.]
MSTFQVDTAQAMMELGAEFASNSKAGDVFALIGTLGTGKTHWSKGFIGKIDPEATVTSPTFSIVNEYLEGSPKIFHFDFYRLKSEQELINLGWDEILDENAIVICEWADMFPAIMPPDTKWLKIEHAENGHRTLTETAAPDPLSSLPEH